MHKGHRKNRTRAGHASDGRPHRGNIVSVYPAGRVARIGVLREPTYVYGLQIICVVFIRGKIVKMSHCLSLYGALPPWPDGQFPRDILTKKKVNLSKTLAAVQAGTPMAAQGEGPFLL